MAVIGRSLPLRLSPDPTAAGRRSFFKGALCQLGPLTPSLARKCLHSQPAGLLGRTPLNGLMVIRRDDMRSCGKMAPQDC